MSKNPVPVATLLSPRGKQLNPLIIEAKRLTQIKILLNQSLDYQIAEHIEVCKVEKNLLILLTDSPVWATRLRYMQQQIIGRLHQYALTKNISKISIKVRPLNLKNQKPKQASRHMALSKSAADQILEETQGISDPKLKAAFERIAKHAK